MPRDCDHQDVIISHEAIAHVAGARLDDHASDEQIFKAADFVLDRLEEAGIYGGDKVLITKDDKNIRFHGPLIKGPQHKRPSSSHDKYRAGWDKIFGGDEA